KLGAKVGYPRNVFDVRPAVQVLLEVMVALENALGVLGQTVRLVDRRLQRCDRIVRASPRLWRQPLKQIERAWIPRPAEVVCQVFEQRNEVVSFFTNPGPALGHHTRLNKFSNFGHVRFRLSRRQLHEGTIPARRDGGSAEPRQTANACAHSSPGWLRETIEIG